MALRQPTRVMRCHARPLVGHHRLSTASRKAEMVKSHKDGTDRLGDRQTREIVNLALLSSCLVAPSNRPCWKLGRIIIYYQTNSSFASGFLLAVVIINSPIRDARGHTM